MAYCHRFDVWTGNSRRTYFISCAVGTRTTADLCSDLSWSAGAERTNRVLCSVAYAVGLVLTFAVMLLSKMGQPALLYLVPCTLLTSSILASVRKEFKQFWSGSSSQVSPNNSFILLQSGCDCHVLVKCFQVSCCRGRASWNSYSVNMNNNDTFCPSVRARCVVIQDCCVIRLEMWLGLHQVLDESRKPLLSGLSSCFSLRHSCSCLCCVCSASSSGPAVLLYSTRWRYSAQMVCVCVW